MLPPMPRFVDFVPLIAFLACFACKPAKTALEVESCKHAADGEYHRAADECTGQCVGSDAETAVACYDLCEAEANQRYSDAYRVCND